MNYLKKRNKMGPPKSRNNPLNMAVDERDRSVLDLVRDAIRHREVVMAYQPVIQAQAPFGTAFHEALLRVLDETGRVVPAREFISQMDKTEDGRKLDCIALDLALLTLQRNREFRISVNVSARSIGYSDWTKTLEKHLRRDKTLGERLILEIDSATAMQNPEIVQDFMDRMQTRGIAFAMDHFGAGEIVMAHLKEFFFDAVKIDGQFVSDISQKPELLPPLRALIKIAQEFEMLIVATSVATREDAEILVENGVDCLQGYIFGAPTLSPPWLEDSKRKATA